MKDILQDIIQHTSSIGFELIKVTGTDKETSINGLASNKSVIIMGTLKNPQPEFIGVFGMPNLNKLKNILDTDEFKENANISILKDNTEYPDAPTVTRFINEKGDFSIDYRLMIKSVVEAQVKNVTFHGTGWDVEFTPSVLSIQRLKRQSSVHSEETTFKTVMEGKDLNIYFGDPSTHSGKFTFQSDLSGGFKKTWKWPVTETNTILSLPGDKTIKISDQGAMEITVDSGLAVYRYLFPAHTK